MSLAGFKKQLNKANQLLNEKIAGAKGTELDSDFVEMERKIDVTGKLIEELITKTQDYLQPNPMARARISAVKGLNNLQNKSRSMAYPQPEGVLGDSMVKHGKDLGRSSSLGTALVECGDAYKQMAEIKYNLEDSVKQNFLDPFNSLLQQDLKEINHHRKKLEGRRLDYDCKKRKGSGKGANEEDLHAAEEKFAESKSLAENAMVNFLSSDAEQMSALYELVSSELFYHQEATRILSELRRRLDEQRSEAASRPKAQQRTSSSSAMAGAAAASSSARSRSSAGGDKDSWKGSTADGDGLDGATGGGGGAGGPTVSIKPRHQSAKTGTPTCRALFTFTADNSTELAFDEGDVIQLVSQVDENWYEGELKGKRGFFPVNYVDIIVPLPPT